MKLRFSALLAFLLVATLATAQNFGYVKSDEVLGKLPKIKAVDSELAAMQKMLVARRDAMVAKLQSEYAALQLKEQQGTIAPKQLEEEGAKLKVQQDSLGTYEQSMSAQYNDKKNELLGPILDEVNIAINAVAKEGGYQYIFDYGAGILLYADETKDVTKLVLAKLGVAQ